MAGDPEAAEALLRADYEALTAMEENYLRPFIAACLARALFEAGRIDEADELAAVAAEIADPDDVEPQAIVRSVRARVLVSRGDAETARALAYEALALIGETDDLSLRADSLLAVAGTLEDSPDERVAVLGEALALFERKRHLIGVERVEAELAGLAPVA
jgi:hypothetical protein